MLNNFNYLQSPHFWWAIIMVLQDLENVYTDVLPGLSLPAGAAWFVLARVEWIRKGEVAAFDLEAPSPWQFSDLCTLAFLVANRETDAARLMVANLLQPPSILLPSATLMDENDNYLVKCPFRRRKQRQGRCASSGPKNVIKSQVITTYAYIHYGSWLT